MEQMKPEEKEALRRKTWATTYKLFSEMTPEEKEALLATATQKIGPKPWEKITYYELPVSSEEFFSPQMQDLLVAMRGTELLGSARFAKQEIEGKEVIELKRLFVFPQYRYLGVGTGLFARLKIISKKKFGLELRENLDDFERPVRRMSKKIAGRKKNTWGAKLKPARKLRP